MMSSRHYIHFQNNATYHLFRFLIDSGQVDYNKLVSDALSEAEAEARADIKAEAEANDEAVAEDIELDAHDTTMRAHHILSRKLEDYVHNEWFKDYDEIESWGIGEVTDSGVGTQILFVPMLADVVEDIKYYLVAGALMRHVGKWRSGEHSPNTPQQGNALYLVMGEANVFIEGMFRHAYERAAASGDCDSVDTGEYRRIFAERRECGHPHPGIEEFIREHAGQS
jgi:hypothetical protein